jgi:hypothetical protein
MKNLREVDTCLSCKHFYKHMTGYMSYPELYCMHNDNNNNTNGNRVTELSVCDDWELKI